MVGQRRNEVVEPLQLGVLGPERCQEVGVEGGLGDGAARVVDVLPLLDELVGEEGLAALLGAEGVVEEVVQRRGGGEVVEVPELGPVRELQREDPAACDDGLLLGGEGDAVLGEVVEDEEVVEAGPVVADEEEGVGVGRDEPQELAQAVLSPEAPVDVADEQARVVGHRLARFDRLVVGLEVEEGEGEGLGLALLLSQPARGVEPGVCGVHLLVGVRDVVSVALVLLEVEDVLVAVRAALLHVLLVDHQHVVAQPLVVHHEAHRGLDVRARVVCDEGLPLLVHDGEGDPEPLSQQARLRADRLDGGVEGDVERLPDAVVARHLLQGGGEQAGDEAVVV